jgi:LuxR family quorum-sensing system transcriptional regulator CciR
MSQLDLVRRFQEHGEASPAPLDALVADFFASIQTLGFGRYACCSHVDPCRPPPQSVMLHNYPPEWVRAFSEARLYEIDPVLKRAESTLFPFFWNEDLRPDKLTKAQRIILAEAAGYGLRNGYTVPIQLSRIPGILRASCSLIPESPHIDPQNYLTAGALATSLYLFAWRAHAPWLTEPAQKLTRRERQCLTLASDGHTDAAIARLLGLSTSTAHHHVENAKTRLAAGTRAQAIARALAMGLIPFRDFSSGE